MNKTTWWIAGLIGLVVVAYGGYRVIKHFMRLAAAPVVVATMVPVITESPAPEISPTESPIPTKAPRVVVPTAAPTTSSNLYGY